MDSVKKFAEENGYEYHLWTETNESELPWSMEPGLRALYRSFGSQLAGKADLIRLVALYKYGGIYIDADTVILKPAKFAEFLEANKAKAFFGWEDLSEKKLKKLGGSLGEGLERMRRLIANGTIGATERNPFIKKLLARVVEHATVQEKGEEVWRRVGPVFVTRIWKEVGPSSEEVKVYPMRYFYPKDWHGIRDPEMHKKVRIPGESMLFQYGYTTNHFDRIFKRRAAAASTRRVKSRGRRVSLKARKGA